MIRHDVSQGEADWFALRLAIPTASEFGKIVTSTGKASTQANGYMNTLLAEWLTGKTGGMESTPWMDRGTSMEPEARTWYEMETDEDAETVGFITRDDGLVGCSPDALIGDSGMLEIKCPSPGVHVEYLLSDALPSKYKPQVQGQLMVAERDWCDFISYHPDMMPLRVRVTRDEDYINTMRGMLDGFVDKMLAKREQLQNRGIEPMRAAA